MSHEQVSGAEISRAQKDNIEAANQNFLAKERLRDIAPLLGSRVRVSGESILDLGKETEPYTEASIDALIAEEWGIIPKKIHSKKKTLRNISIQTS